jgi:hypothetical protein
MTKGKGTKMYKYLNVHPKGLKVGDCVKRAFTVAMDKDYMEVQRELNHLKKETGAKVFNDNHNWKAYVSKQGWKKLSFPAVKGEPRMDGYTFADTFPKGTYVLRMAGHLTVCKDGVIYDIWDCRKKCVYNAWKVK